MQDLGPLFHLPPEPHYLWVVILVFSLLTIGVSALGLVRSLPATLAAPGLALLPIFTYVLGNLSVLEESKTVEFCGSCHQPMAPVVAAMMDGSDESLSSIHYRMGAVSHIDACYECHSGYGIWGDVQAKTAGVQHMLHTVTGSYEFPLEHRGVFNIDSCRGCHAAAQPFRDVESHRDPDIQKMLMDGEMTCTGTCHPAAHPDWALNGIEGVPPDKKALVDALLHEGSGS